MSNNRMFVYLSIALAAAVVIMIFLWPDYPEYDSSAWRRELSSRETQIKTLGLQNQTLLNELWEDSIKGAEEKRLFVGQISRLKSRLAQQRPKVDSIIIENPVLIDYVNSADSVIEVQTNRIAALDHEVSKLQASTAMLTANFEERIRLHQERDSIQSQVIESQSKQLSKERKKNRLTKIGAVIGVGIAFLLGGKTI